MPSIVLGYVPGSGFMPCYSGNPWSGTVTPVGGVQLRADRNNSGNVYVSLSGAYVFSGQVGCLPGSGGPTITSGGMPISGGSASGWGAMDGMQLGPGDAYFVPKVGIVHGPVASGAFGSGTVQLCVGCDSVCSGQARVYFDAF